ncbi:MAG: PKD domain-containing protein [Bacteroidota bacterium]|nr:PKD domain-containing protein [Bacteroidota bacterium]
MKKILTIITIVFLSLVYEVSNAQNYCTPSYNGSGQKSRWFCHLLNVRFGDIDRTTAAPYNWNWPNTIYENFTNISTDVVPQQTYPISIYVGNGANSQYVSVWIDFNHNFIFESSERVLSQKDFGNTGDHIIRGNVTIPSNASIGKTRMRVGTNIILSSGQSAPDPCTNNETANLANVGPISSQHFQDFEINILQPAIQYYVSSNTIQLLTNEEVTKASSDNPIIRIDVNTNPDGILSPLKTDTFYISLLGTTNPNEISNAKLYYTGINPEFSSSNQVGTTVGSPGTYFKFSPNQSLQPGTNHFWLTYDVTSDAIIGNVLDARCNGVFVNTRRVPSTIDPKGSRTIGYCVSKGTKTFIYVRAVNLRNINHYGYPYYNNDGYQDWTNYTATLYKGYNHTLSIETGNGVNSNLTQAWIDFNQDGFFDDATEKVLTDSLVISNPPPYVYGPVVDSFSIPINSPVGKTRMRIISHYNPNNPPHRPHAKPCSNPVEIGEVEDYSIILADSGQAVADFSSTISCLGDSSIFTDKSYVFGSTFHVNAWNWDFDDGNTSNLQNPKHKFTLPGVYNVKLTVKSNFTGAVISSVTKPVSVNDPVANFSITSNLYKIPIEFIDETSGGKMLAYPNGHYWDFGDPASGYNNYSQDKSPKHTYNSVGNYSVTLIVTSEGGCIDTVVKTISIDSVIKPIANFSASSFNPYFDKKITFLDISVNDPTYWRWEVSPSSFKFHDSTTKLSKSPVISFDNVSVYAVRLVVSNNAGSDSITKVITTKNYIKPVADFSATPTIIKAGQVISFLDKSKNDPTNWTWSFGNSDSSFVQYPKTSYSGVGHYTVSLKASNPAGNDTKIITNYIEVTNEYKMCDGEAPFSNLFSGLIYDSGGRNEEYKNGSNCSFIIEPPCAGPITLNFSSFDMKVSDYIYVYDGDSINPKKLLTPNGLSGSTIPSSITARSGAMLIVELTNSVETDNGFIATWSAIPNITPNPSIVADSIGYLNGPVRFTNGTSLGAGNTYYWDYNNDNVIDDVFTSLDMVTDGSYAYDSLGYYTVKLIAKNCKGSDTSLFVIHIKQPTQPPIADFHVFYDDTIVAEGQKVYFEDLSSMGPTRWKWEITPPDYFSIGYFADGTADTSQNPIIQFYGLGGYDISLTATNIIGSSPKVIKKKYILVIPQVTMGAWPFVRNEEAGRIFDSGGPEGNYSNNEDHNFLIDPCAKEVYLTFKQFDLAAGDYLRIYDGVDNTGKALFPGNGFSANVKPTQTLIAESGSMFLEMETDYSTVGQGFDATWTIDPIDLPLASYDSPDSAFTGGNIVLFNNTSTGKEIEKYYWDYDHDGITDDSTFNGKYSFMQTGYKFATLTAVNCAGKDVFSKMINVFNPTQKPQADFVADIKNADTSDIITFSDLSLYGPNKWTWDFATKKVEYVNSYDTVFPRALIKFDTTGTFDVSLVAKNSFGSDTSLKKQYVNIFAYCRPTVQNMLSNFGISRVVINNLDNTSKAGVSQYTDYTNFYSATLELGGTYNFEINSSDNTYPYERKIWIDFNQNGIFDDSSIVAGELVALAKNSTDLIWIGTLTVPPDAKLGQTRMRIGVDYGGYDDKPCGPNFFGEFEDYRIHITKDKTPPKISLKGNPIAFGEIGHSYIDSGATAWDAVDGNLTNQIVTTTNVDSSVQGEYWIKFNVSDVANNNAEEVKRRIFITPDRTPPVITLLGDNPMDVAVFHSYNAIEPGATAFDERDGNVSSLIQIEHTVDTARVDSYHVIYSAFDFNGNFSRKERTVLVIDTVAPVIYVIGKEHVWITVGASYKDSGAYAIDNYYHDIKITTSTNLDVNKDGWYWIKYYAHDKDGNHAIPKERTIRVGDPISVDETFNKNDISIYPNPSKGQLTLSFNLAKANSKRINISVLNELGQVVRIIEKENLTKEKLILNLTNEAGGIYVLRVTVGDDIVIKKITLVK